jgi:hypothetical protein
MAASLLAGESGPAWTSGVRRATRTVEEMNEFVEALMDPTRTARTQDSCGPEWMDRGACRARGPEEVNPCSGGTDG